MIAEGVVWVVGLAESLLTWLHGFVGASVCPGDWVWTTTALGAVLGLFPTVGALLSGTGFGERLV